MSTIRNAISCLPLPENLSLTTSNSIPSHQGLVGFLRSLFESITARIYSTLRRSPLTCLPFPESYGLETKHVYQLQKMIFQHTLFSLHRVQENLQYWTTCKDNDIQHPETETVLKTIGRFLTIFLSQVYVDFVEFDVFEERNSSVASLLGAINGFLLNLQESVHPINEICDICPLSFEELPRRDEENIGSVQNDYDIRDANLILSNLNKLDLYLSLVIDKYRRPSKVIHRRMRYTLGVGAIGISLISVWFLRHSSVVIQAKESLTRFFSYNVEQPLRNIRDGLFKRFLIADKFEMALKKVQSGSDDLHSFEKQISQLIGNLTKDDADFARSMLIQFQEMNAVIDAELSELKHDKVMIDEMRYTIFAALPTVFLSIGALMISPWVVYRYTMRQSTISSMAYEERRLLLNDVEDSIMELQDSNLLPPQTQEAHYTNGLVLFTLDRLSIHAERDAKENGEWDCLQEELFNLGNTKLGIEYRLSIISRLRRMYSCLHICTPISSLNNLTEGRLLEGNVSNREEGESIS